MTKSLFLLLVLFPFLGTSQETAASPPPETNTGIYCDASTTWNGTAWSNGLPSIDKDVIFTANHTCAVNTFYACSIFVSNNAQVSFIENTTVFVRHKVNVDDNASLIFENNSSLIQTENIENEGNIILKKESAKIIKDDLVLWSSPVSGEQTLLDFSPETLLNRFYIFDTSNNIYNSVSNPETTVFTKAKGYLIRTPESHPASPTSWQVQFEGVPNNGNISIPLSYTNESNSYNAVGNPYPSAISIEKFIDANSNTIDGTVWLWKKTAGSTKSSYITVTKLGYQANTPSTTNNDNPFVLHPEGVIDATQGFIVKAKNNEELIFNNEMRIAVDYSLLETDDIEEFEASRYWINVTGTNIFSQALIGYTAEATLEYDNGLDGQAIMDSGVTLYTIGNNKKFAIQARPTFNTTDIVHLGFKSQTAGTFQITLDHMDGIFAGGQNIYLKDNANGTFHHLNNGSYSFTSAIGTFENRFLIVYDEALGTRIPSINPQQIIISSSDKQIKIKSSGEIKSIAVYDLPGRLIYGQNNINALEFSSQSINAAQQVVIATITLNNGQIISKKIVLQ